MLFDRPGIVPPLVAEDVAEDADIAGIGDELVPIIVSDLVTKMSEQCAIRLAHFAPLALALDVVGLRDIQRDQSAGMPGDHLSRAGRKKIERQTVRIFGRGDKRQLETQQ